METQNSSNNSKKYSPYLQSQKSKLKNQTKQSSNKTNNSSLYKTKHRIYQNSVQHQSPLKSPYQIRNLSENYKNNEKTIQKQRQIQEDENHQEEEGELNTMFDDFHNNFQIKFSQMNFQQQQQQISNEKQYKQQNNNNNYGHSNYHDGTYPQEAIVKPLTSTFSKLVQCNNIKYSSPLRRRQGKNIIQSQPLVQSLEKSMEKTQKINHKQYQQQQQTTNNDVYDSYINEFLKDQQKTLVRQKKKMNLNNIEGNNSIIGKITIKVPKQKAQLFKSGFFQDTNGDIFTRDRIQTINCQQKNPQWKFQQYNPNYQDNIFQQQQQQQQQFGNNNNTNFNVWQEFNQEQQPYPYNNNNKNDNIFAVKPVINNNSKLNMNQQQNISKLNRKIQLAGKNIVINNNNNSNQYNHNNNNLGTFLQNVQKGKKKKIYLNLNNNDKENINPNIIIQDQQQDFNQNKQSKTNQPQYKSIIFKESLEDITNKLKQQKSNKNQTQQQLQHTENINENYNVMFDDYGTQQIQQQQQQQQQVYFGNSVRGTSLQGRKNKVYQQTRQQSVDTNYLQQNRLMKQSFDNNYNNNIFAA